MSWFALRTTFYSLLLTLALLENGLLFFTAIFGGRQYPLTFLYSAISFIIALFTWIWISVLLSKNKIPDSTQDLATSKAHFWSFFSFTAAWSILAILFTTAVPKTCYRQFRFHGMDTYDNVGCYTTVGAMSGAWGIFVLALTSAISIFVVVRRHGATLLSNISQFDNDESV